MNPLSSNDIAAWEGEGGAVRDVPGGNPPVLSGTEAQVEWANRIRRQVDADFDRVAASFRAIAARQIRSKRAETESILAILEEKRTEVMGMTHAGYFIHDWQEIDDQIRKLIFSDPRYQAIKSRRSHPGAGAAAAKAKRPIDDPDSSKLVTDRKDEGPSPSPLEGSGSR